MVGIAPSLGMVKVIHGANDDRFDNIVGSSVMNVRASLVDAFNVPGDALALVNGRQVGMDYRLQANEVLEFVVQWAWKGSRSARTAEAILSELDLLRDRRTSNRITEDNYHAEWDRLWDDLREADRKKRRLAEQKAREEQMAVKEEHERRPKVYCDGCCEPGQPLGVGVYSADCGIEISLQLDQAGTNNVAECLGAITALKECKKRGITGIRLLSDSQLVVYWTRGEYALKSNTAQKYVPTIRQLLSEVGASIEWIPGKQNLADKYSRNLQLFPDNLSPLEKLKTIPSIRLAFKDYLGVKSGRDEFSRMKKDTIIQLLEAGEWQEISAAFDKEKYQLSAARWRLRELPIETAIRKVEVDREVGHNVAKKRNRSAWDDDD